MKNVVTVMFKALKNQNYQYPLSTETNEITDEQVNLDSLDKNIDLENLILQYDKNKDYLEKEK